VKLATVPPIRVVGGVEAEFGENVLGEFFRLITFVKDGSALWE
jgi:hypothetical protein